eukprot:Skav208201  [mRNA]  locus=scaffold2026:153188:158570:+ [translate_table: standard]
MVIGGGALQTHRCGASSASNSFDDANFVHDPTRHEVHYPVLYGACRTQEYNSDAFTRVGEASNPGPEVLRLGTFNPGQVLGHENTVAEWGKGIWCASETSHTVIAQKLSASRLRKSKMNSLWSPPVPCHSGNTGSMRGKASGVAIISHLPVVPYPSVMRDDVAASSRLVEGLVDLGSGSTMYVASVYGPTHNATYFDPWSILASLCTCAFEHAHAFQGPAAVVGDFNVDLQQIPFWESMAKRGWVDAAAFDAQQRSVQPKATSRGNARKSFVLVNPALLESLVKCDVTETYDFDTHPLLVAEFDVVSLHKPRCVWNLPASTDDLFFDDDLLRASVVQEQMFRQGKFENAMRDGDSEEALRQINLTFEAALKASVVDTDGSMGCLPRRCFGRSRKKLTKIKAASDPVVKKGRHGEFTPQICQPSVRIRQWTRQVRRLHTCSRQMNSYMGNQNTRALVACTELWKAILTAAGFPTGFCNFALTTLGLFIPEAIPNSGYIKYIGDSLKAALLDEIRRWDTAVQETRLIGIRRDFQRGGSRAFKSVRDPQAPPFHAIVHEVSVSIVPQRWTRGGISRLLFQGDASNFNIEFPVYFQHQEAFILSVDGNCLTLDRRVINKDYNDRKLWQRQTVTDTDELHKLTAAAWSGMWLRDPKDDCEENWPAAIDNLRSLHDVPTMEYRPLEVAEWKRHAATTKVTSARGACAYTPRELRFMPEELCVWLLALMTAIEQGDMQWPASIMTARVAFPFRRETFFKKLADYTGGRHSGPATVFAKTLLDHGWTCEESGWLIHSSGLAFNWYTAPKSLLTKMLAMAWQMKLCTAVQGRKHFDLSNVDIAGIQQALRGLNPEETSAALNFLVGKHVTFDALGHYANGGGSFQCPLCGCVDGREHRLLHCRELESIRALYPGLGEWLQQQSQATMYFGLLPWDVEWMINSCQQLAVWPRVSRPPSAPCELVCMFTDGSAFFTECFTVSLAAGAWILVDGPTVLCEGASVVPGVLHTAYRGEIWSVVLALQQRCYVNIHSDCSAVCAVGAGLVAARQAGSTPLVHEHSDLWDMVWELLLTRPSGSVSFTKVKAHQNPSTISDPTERWCAEMNNYVDLVAKRCVKAAARGSIRCRERFCKQRATNVRMLTKLFQCWNAMNSIVLKKVQAVRPLRNGTMPNFTMLVDPAALQLVPCDISEQVLAACPYGDVFARRVVGYLNGLQWDMQKPSVSLLELYFDFSLFTGTVSPIFHAFTASRGSRGVYKLPDLSIQSDERHGVQHVPDEVTR